MTLSFLRSSALSVAALSLVLAWSCPTDALAVGASVDVSVVDRDAAGALPVYPFRGRFYVAGRPGARYALRITNRTGERMMAVMSVDGVNILSGRTADIDQGGYVLAPWQSYEITGWRKTAQEVAAFEFTALPDSYAARTGRPNDVGVIGVAVFNERKVQRPEPSIAPESSSTERSKASRADASADRAAPPAPSPDVRQERPALEERLGTGHGARESSYVTSTTFVRRTSRPVEIVNIRYDRFENLVRAGVIPQFGLGEPNPFPASARNAGFVPDPPAR